MFMHGGRGTPEGGTDGAQGTSSGGESFGLLGFDFPPGARVPSIPASGPRGGAHGAHESRAGGPWVRGRAGDEPTPHPTANGDLCLVG